MIRRIFFKWCLKTGKLYRSLLVEAQWTHASLIWTLLWFPFIASRCSENAPFFMYSFNECHNNKIKKRQMDMMIRYWDNSTNLLSTKYCNSDFSCCCCFGKASTDDVRTKFEICSSPTNKMIQVYFNKSNSVDHSNSTLFFYP